MRIYVRFCARVCMCWCVISIYFFPICFELPCLSAHSVWVLSAQTEMQQTFNIKRLSQIANKCFLKKKCENTSSRLDVEKRHLDRLMPKINIQVFKIFNLSLKIPILTLTLSHQITKENLREACSLLHMLHLL